MGNSSRLPGLDVCFSRPARKTSGRLVAMKDAQANPENFWLFDCPEDAHLKLLYLFFKLFYNSQSLSSD